MEKNILVVEDKSLHMEQACKLLQNMDVNVKIFKAFTFEEAIVIASQHRIHVFLVDGREGYSVFEESWTDILSFNSGNRVY